MLCMEMYAGVEWQWMFHSGWQRKGSEQWPRPCHPCTWEIAEVEKPGDADRFQNIYEVPAQLGVCIGSEHAVVGGQYFEKRNGLFLGLFAYKY
jgi:hypothetical protein